MVLRPSLLMIALLSSSLALTAQDLIIRTVDLQGALVPGAAIEIRTAGAGPKVFSGVTDAQGTFTVQAALPAQIQVTAAGFEPWRRKVESCPPGGIRVQLVPAALRTTIDVVVHDAPGPEIAVEQTALEIERSSARTVFDAVETLVPSAYVTRRGILGLGLGQAGSMTLRGLGGSPTTELLVVIDGRPDFMGLMGHPLPDLYTLTDVGGLSVTEGPASVLYGSNAMGGAIEVKPRRPLEGVHTSLMASLGSYYTGQYRLSNGARFGRAYYNLTAGFAHTDGARPNSAFRDQDGTLSVGYAISERWRTSLEGRYGHFFVEDPGVVSRPQAGNWSRVGRGGFSWDLDNTGSHTWGLVRVYSSFGHNMIYDGFRSVDTSLGFRAVQSFLVVPQVTVDAGTDVIRYGGRARDISPDYNYGEFHINDFAGFSRLRYAATRKLLLNAGIRYDENSHSGDIVVPEFGAVYRLAEKYSISVAASRGFRNPTIRELYLFPAPTPTLLPERMWNYQGTFQARPATKLLAWITGYYSNLDNLIVTTGYWPNLHLQNSGRAINKGIETHARWQPADRASFNVAYAYLHSTNLAPYSPQNRLTYSLDFDARRVFISVGGNTVGRTYSGPGKTLPVGEYTLVNIKCTVPLGEHSSLFATVDNILNRQYEVLAGYPMPGTNAAGGFNLSF
ncbi:MAG TPA: TonB-dependent receptor [Terriglobia bacterium]|nr:TonB-dependent receptor [Terriglobia bacterium]